MSYYLCCSCTTPFLQKLSEIQPSFCSMPAAVKLLIKLGHICLYTVTIDDGYSVCAFVCAHMLQV